MDSMLILDENEISALEKLNEPQRYSAVLAKYRSMCPRDAMIEGSRIVNESLNESASRGSLIRVAKRLIDAPTRLFRFTYEPVQVEEKKYYLTVDCAYKLYTEHIKRGTSQKLAWAMSCGYLAALLGCTLLQVPIEGIDLAYDIDQSFRSPIWFLIKNYSIGLLQMIASGTISFNIPYASYIGVWISISAIIAYVKHIVRLSFFETKDVQIIQHQGV